MAYNLLTAFQIIKNGNMAGSITGPIEEIKYQDNIGIQLNWTGSPSGTFSVLVSMDHKQDSNGNVTVPGNFIALPLSPAITATGTPDIAYIDLNQLSASYIQVVYTMSGGTGTLNAFMTGKAV